jgi:hypothetical protein
VTPPRLRAGRLLDAAAIRAAAETQPRLRGFMRTVAAHSEGGDVRATRLMEHIITRVVDDIGDIYVPPSLLRLEKIEILRNNVAAILDTVLEGHELPAGTSVESLGRFFDELSTEMRELSRPREAIVGDEPLDIYHDAADYAETIVREFEATPAAGGRHVEPQAALQDAFRNLPAEQQAALRRATETDPRAVWAVVSSGSEAGGARKLADLEAALAGRLGAKELEDLRAGLAELGRARSTGLQVSAGRLNEALARIADPELRGAVAASTDVWIVQQVAIHNPEGLATLWRQFRAKGGAATDAAGFRGYMRHEMVTFGRAVPAEYTAAFSLSSVEQFLKGPDANPRLRGTDLVGITADDWVWLIDDKSHRSASVSSVSALTDHLAENLRRDAADFRTAIADLKARDPAFEADPRVIHAIERMEDTAAEVEYIERHGPASTRPERIDAVLQVRRLALKVTSAMGEVREISEALRDLGLAVEPTGTPVPLPPRGRQ